MSSSIIQPCSDTTDVVNLYKPAGLFLKPIARFHISVQLPVSKISGKGISNWEVMDKLKALLKPDEFTVLKVSKSTLEFIRFEAEIESKLNLPHLISRLDQRKIKLSGFSEALKIRACEAKPTFPAKHDWDSFFRDAKNMNEMKPGERPDTVYLANLPCRWFIADKQTKSDPPSEYLLRKVFEQYGELRHVDIPLADSYRNKMDPSVSGLRTATFGQDGLFEAYIQFQEYVGFVKAMSALKGMKLLYKENSKAWTASIKVDFDKTKHLTDLCIKKRNVARDKLMEEEREMERQERKRRELEELKKEDERRRMEAARKEQERLVAEKESLKEQKWLEKVERKRERKVQKKMEMARVKMGKKVALEERKLLLTQRNLESIRLLDELLEHVKVVRQKEIAQKKEEELLKELDHLQKKKTEQERKKAEKEAARKAENERREKDLRSKLMRKYKELEENRMEEQRERLRSAIEGQATKLKSVLAQVYKEFPAPVLSDSELSLSEESPPHNCSPRFWRNKKSCSRSRSRSRTSHRSSDYHTSKPGRLDVPPNHHGLDDTDRELWDGPNQGNYSSYAKSRNAYSNSNHYSRGNADRKFNSNGYHSSYHAEQQYDRYFRKFGNGHDRRSGND